MGHFANELLKEFDEQECGICDRKNQAWHLYADQNCTMIICGKCNEKIRDARNNENEK